MKQISRNKDKGNFLERYIKSFIHAISGFWYALVYEHNMIIIVPAIIVTSGLGLYYHIDKYEWLFCILCFGAVMATEMLNTAIEALVDLVTTEYHPLAKIAKDTVSTATLVFCVTAFVGALIIFVPKIF
ncbi:MAG TPA: diacylglycerol kinase family protein [Bacilli bacterium]|nr:diacylglycerol kinase family protein [Bacilli bacterium]